VIIDGQSISEGAQVAWVPYWGCANKNKANLCDKLLPQTIHNGEITVTFPHIEEYIPCYKGIGAEEYECYDNIRMKVKNVKSFPGWSLASDAPN